MQCLPGTDAGSSYRLDPRRELLVFDSVDSRSMHLRGATAFSSGHLLAREAFCSSPDLCTLSGHPRMVDHWQERPSSAPRRRCSPLLSTSLALDSPDYQPGFDTRTTCNDFRYVSTDCAAVRGDSAPPVQRPRLLRSRTVSSHCERKSRSWSAGVFFPSLFSVSLRLAPHCFSKEVAAAAAPAGRHP